MTLDYVNGAILTEQSSSELRVIGTNAYLVDSYFLHQLQCLPNLTLLCSPANP